MGVNGALQPSVSSAARADWLPEHRTNGGTTVINLSYHNRVKWPSVKSLVLSTVDEIAQRRSFSSKHCC